MALTQLQKDMYLEDSGMHCPWCKSDNISGRSFEVDSAWACRGVECGDCGKEWDDIYRLESIEEVEVP